MVEVRRGLGGGQGEPVAQAAAGADGRFSIAELPSGNYELSAVADEYAAGFQRAVVCGGVSQPETGIALAPVGETPFRIMAEWAQPEDLDLHLQVPSGEEVYSYEPCRGALAVAPYSALDVDRQHAVGPEAIAISNFLPGRYTVFLHNYSLDEGNSEIQLTDSDAQVVVDAAGGNTVLGRFPVPTSGSGSGWDVLWFDGSDPTNLRPM
ncbi:MAG: hypothetical protein OXU20_24735 [Myxococcales bacterium]|nr:hypothetical protein [Myxococcales bacterium]